MSLPADKKRVLFRFYLSLFLLGLLVVQLFQIHPLWTAIRTHQQTWEDKALQLSFLAHKLKDQSNFSREHTEQMAFLQNLPNLLPEQAKFIKTHNILQEEVETLRSRVGKRMANQLYILVDTKASKLYLKQGLKLIRENICSVGRGGILVDKQTGRKWEFSTPKGLFQVTWKTEDPLWIKPDWAFAETKQLIPPPDDPSRLVQGELGKYLLSMGNGYLIHGTKNEASLGQPVSHGCIRLGAEDLDFIYHAANLKTRVYVY
ncbi:MAG: L,D-transpeptidase [Elusimicrobia bacterium]|nr:L,D-transpeptidase [Elusimicrobiota bacterium]